MPRTNLKAGALLCPVPIAMVSCGTVEKPNILTIGWTGIINTQPPMTYVSIRPSRYSYNIIKDTKEFVINLTTSNLVRSADFCGVKSGENTDKLKETGLTVEKSNLLDAPLISQCPLALECRVAEIKPLGTHDMFIAEIVSVSVDEKLLGPDGRINLHKAGLAAYAHGEYFELGKSLGTFGFSVRKKPKKKQHYNKSKNIGKK